MEERSAQSRCASGESTRLYWRFCVSDDLGDHSEAIVDAVVLALSGPTRRWNMWNRGTVKGEIRDRLVEAAEGKLVPMDHVKSLRGGRDHLYEIRWRHINVTDQDETGELKYGVTEARVIHVEPEEHPRCVVGLLAHEKPKADGAKALQDDAIDRAEVLYRNGRSSTWGVTIAPGAL